MKKLIAIIALSSAVTAGLFYWGLGTQNATESEGAPQALRPSGKLLIMSDIHFNPFYDPKIVNKLLHTDYTDWKAVFESSSDSTFGVYGSDTYYKLLKSGLQAMQGQNKQPDMIIINGDFLSHDFEEDFEQLTGIDNQDSLEAFIRKTTSFVSLMLSQYFPNTFMLPVVGNNDDYCGDYHIQPQGPFLSFFANQFKPLLHPSQQRDFMDTFLDGGYYMVKMPWDTSQVFIGLNTVFMSPKYSNICNPSDTTDPALRQLEWLQAALDRCQKQGKKVWFSCHIPPGIDVYASTHNYGPCKYGATGMWRQSYNDAFISLINKYSSCINAGLAGHTHMNDFRLLGTDSSIYGFLNITPAISPIFGNNPSFQELIWDIEKMQFLNINSYAFMGIQNPGQNTWELEYDYAKTYGISRIDVGSMTDLWKRIGQDSTVRNSYLRFYATDNPSSIPSPWKAYWCGIRFQTKRGFTDCNCVDH